MPRAYCPGFQPDSKVKMLLELKDRAEIIIAINADDIEKTSSGATLLSHMTSTCCA